MVWQVSSEVSRRDSVRRIRREAQERRRSGIPRGSISTRIADEAAERGTETNGRETAPNRQGEHRRDELHQRCHARAIWRNKRDDRTRRSRFRRGRTRDKISICRAGRDAKKEALREEESSAANRPHADKAKGGEGLVSVLR